MMDGGARVSRSGRQGSHLTRRRSDGACETVRQRGGMKAALASWLLRRSWLGNATMADFARSSPRSPMVTVTVTRQARTRTRAFAQYLIHGV